MRSDSSHLAHSFILSLVQFTKCLLSKYLLLLGAGGRLLGSRATEIKAPMSLEHREDKRPH